MCFELRVANRMAVLPANLGALAQGKTRQLRPAVLSLGREGKMHDIISVIGNNGLWVMIIAVVAIGGWFKLRDHELRVQQEMRAKEMAHQEKMKELELEVEKAKAKQTT